MLKLLAAAFEDGWAFVKRNGEILLVRPPYYSWNLSVVSESTLEKAIHAHGFAITSESFNDWGTLTAFLQQRLVETRKAQGQAMPSSDAIRTLVQYASENVLQSYLDRIQTELIPNREWKAALDLLTTLLRLDKIKKNSELFGRTVNLLEQCQWAVTQATTQKQQLVNEPDDLKRQFPYAVGRYGVMSIINYSNTISQRRQLLALGR
jgi:hypothetical protein